MSSTITWKLDPPTGRRPKGKWIIDEGPSLSILFLLNTLLRLYSEEFECEEEHTQRVYLPISGKHSMRLKFDADSLFPQMGSMFAPTLPQGNAASNEIDEELLEYRREAGYEPDVVGLSPDSASKRLPLISYLLKEGYSHFYLGLRKGGAFVRWESAYDASQRAEGFVVARKPRSRPKDDIHARFIQPLLDAQSRVPHYEDRTWRVNPVDFQLFVAGTIELCLKLGKPYRLPSPVFARKEDNAATLASSASITTAPIDSPHVATHICSHSSSCSTSAANEESLDPEKVGYTSSAATSPGDPKELDSYGAFPLVVQDFRNYQTASHTLAVQRDRINTFLKARRLEELTHRDVPAFSENDGDPVAIATPDGDPTSTEYFFPLGPGAFLSDFSYKELKMQPIEEVLWTRREKLAKFSRISMMATTLLQEIQNSTGDSSYITDLSQVPLSLLSPEQMSILEAYFRGKEDIYGRTRNDDEELCD